VSSADPNAVSIVVRMLAAQNLLLTALRRGFGPDLSLARFDLLAQLLREDGQTLAQLSRRMLVTAGNLTGLVDRAERDGIVERRPDPNDRRLTRVSLTNRGQKLAQKAIAKHGELAEQILGPLEGKEREELRRLLGRLREALELALGGPPKTKMAKVQNGRRGSGKEMTR
jgi:DNA-binding MarR family transcriptional regulator